MITQSCIVICPNHINFLKNDIISNVIEKPKKILDNLDSIVLNGINVINNLINQGHVLYELEKYPDALKHFNNALKLDPNNINALNNKTAALAQLEKISGCIEMLQ